MIKNFIVLIQLSSFLGIRQIFATEFIYKYKSNFLKTPGTITSIIDSSTVGADKIYMKIRALFREALAEEINSMTIVDFEECNIFVAIKEEFSKKALQDSSQLRTENIKIKVFNILKDSSIPPIPKNLYSSLNFLYSTRQTRRNSLRV